MKSVIWDWNGTLLNDTELCVSSMNVLLVRRGLEPLTVERYKEVFNFPVIDYYKSIGFDFSQESFDIPAKEFIDEYNKNFQLAALQPGVKEALVFFQHAGIDQYILSAMEQEQLIRTISVFGIANFFKEIAGIEDYFAHSKIERGLKLFGFYKLDPADILMIGDTMHDYEVSGTLGCKCIFVANGHHPAGKLKITGAPVFENLEELILNETI